MDESISAIIAIIGVVVGALITWFVSYQNIKKDLRLEALKFEYSIFEKINSEYSNIRKPKNETELIDCLFESFDLFDKIKPFIKDTDRANILNMKNKIDELMNSKKYDEAIKLHLQFKEELKKLLDELRCKNIDMIRHEYKLSLQ